MTLIESLKKMTVPALKKEISKQNIKRYSKLKKEELIILMISTEHKDKFEHLIKIDEEIKTQPIKTDDEKEFIKQFLLKYNEYVKIHGIKGKIFSSGNIKGYVIVNELDRLIMPKFINEMNDLIGKTQTPNIIVNSNNYKQQIIKSLYFDSIKDKGFYKIALKQSNKFISEVKNIRSKAIKQKKRTIK